VELKSVEDTSWLQLFIKNTVAATISLQPSSASRVKRYTYRGHSLSRSYGVNLPSSFSRVLSSALEFSSHPPVLVCGTVFIQLKLSGFSWKHGITHLAPRRALRYRVSTKLLGFA